MDMNPDTDVSVMADPPRQQLGQVKFIRLIFCDLSGVRRARVIPWSKRHILEGTGVTITLAIMAIPAYVGAVSPDAGIGVVGDLYLTVKPSILHPCPWHPNHCIVLPDFQAAPEPGLSERVDSHFCPRTQLRRLLAQLHVDRGLEFSFGHELEFCLAHKRRPDESWDAPLRPIDHSVYAQSTAVDNAAVVLDAICDALAQMGISVEQYHAEAATGQFEIVLEQAGCLEMADKIILTRETIACVASRHGFISTFLPKPYLEETGSGAHTHLSVRTTRKTRDPDFDANSHFQDQFLAGLLHHLAAIYIFIAPSPSSYWRLQPGSWSGAFRCWGQENKSAALRICGAGSSRHIEVKGMDSTSNPYIAFSAILTAGALGIVKGMSLPPPLQTDPDNLPGLERLPSSVADAIKAFEKDTEYNTVLEQRLSRELVKAYLALRREDMKMAAKMSKQEQIYRLLERY